MGHPFNSIVATGLWVVPGLLIDAAPALARTPFMGQTQIPPALTLALALTALVLFLLYLFQKTVAKSAGTASKTRAFASGNQLSAGANLPETHNALNSLFSHSAIAMVKTPPDRSRIIDATPAMCRILGYTKADLLSASPADLGILPSEEALQKQLARKGWGRHVAPLHDRATGTARQFRILDIVIRPAGHPVVLTIVSETPDKGAARWESPDVPDNTLKNSTFN